MIDQRVVELGNEYLDSGATTGQQATLAGMHAYIDARNKTLPLLEEVNEMLVQRPAMGIRRERGTVLFSATGTEHIVTADDMNQAYEQYRADFAAALANLRGKGRR